MFKNKTILITGGTGSFGNAFVNEIIIYAKKIIIFSRDEFKQLQMQNRINSKYHHKLRFFLGDVRDKDRLYTAIDRVDILIHAAALKQVPAAEYNPFEFIKTNVIGAQNIIEACIDKGVKKIIALSTDKAAAPVNLYGATKLCSDKLFIAANNYTGSKNVSFSVVRYGNVLGSRGSIIPLLLSKKDNDVLPITDLNMTRFNITLNDGVKMVLWSIKNMRGGEIFVPKISSYRLSDVVKAIRPNSRIKIIGIRPGEKLHEEMITSSDGINSVDIGKYFAILPSGNESIMNFYLNKKNAKRMPENFNYNSRDNNSFLNVSQIKKLVLKEKKRLELI
tara:strand:- start:15146 stop:16147 length:1002 start_codon:yes stop_codon:yes gene_type:complete